jgi:hypothetical protein
VLKSTVEKAGSSFFFYLSQVPDKKEKFTETFQRLESLVELEGA